MAAVAVIFAALRALRRSLNDGDKRRGADFDRHQLFWARVSNAERFMLLKFA
jgi:hypothetical protein